MTVEASKWHEMKAHEILYKKRNTYRAISGSSKIKEKVDICKC